MIGLKAIVDFLVGWTANVKLQVTLPSWWPSAVTLAIGAILIGVILALWGGRLLRLVYVLGFIVLGGAVGVHVARAAGIDLLIGLVLGAGIAGLAGHLLYRWWVGMSVACCAALLVMGVAAVRNLPDVQASFQQFQEQRGTAASSPRPLEAATASGKPADSSEVLSQAALVLRAYVTEASQYFWQAHRDVVYRVGVVVGLAWITGLGMGLTLPRFTTILGTSCIGLIMILVGSGVLAAQYWPAALEAAESRDQWVLVGAGVLLLISLVMQARHRRPLLPPPAPPAPASKAT
jgi:hypothetical protein